MKNTKKYSKNAKRDFGILFGGLVAMIIIAVVVAYMGTVQRSFSSNVTVLTYKTYTEKLDNDESFLLVLCSTEEKTCDDFEPTIDDALNETGTTAYYLYYDKLESTDQQTVIANLNASTLPTVYYYDKGLLVAETLSDEISKQDLINFINRYEK